METAGREIYLLRYKRDIHSQEERYTFWGRVVYLLRKRDVPSYEER